jgi:predicted extracellular nuclease
MSSRPRLRFGAAAVGSFLVVVLAIVASPASASPSSPVLNEFVFNHTGADIREFVEVFADANTDLSGLSILQLEGDGTGPGVVDTVLPVGTTDANGFWVSSFLSNAFENGTVTLLLADGFSGAAGTDLDTDNDGVLDSTPWTSLIDDVAVDDAGAGDRTYSSSVLTPGFGGGSFSVGGASRIPNGADTGAVDDWVRNDFDGAGLPGFTGTPDVGESLNTPGAVNVLITPPPPPVLTIMEIQGSGQFSPFGGQTVETSGVVTLFTVNGASCWIQDPSGDSDPATSDGIFVSGCGFPAEGAAPAVGDQIRIIGSVQEQQFGVALPLTRLRNVALIETVSSGNPPPTSVALIDLPNESIAAGIDFWEPLEGMLVDLIDARVVAATNAFGELVALTEADAVPGSGTFPQTKQILVRSLGANQVDYNPERVMVDDGSLSSPIIVRPGDRLHHLTGVVDYTFGNYKLQPVTFDVSTRRLPQVPVSKRSGPRGDFVLTTFNVENLFDLADEPGKDDEDSTPSPAVLEIKLSKLALAIERELQLPEILVVQEIENQSILQTLGDRVNAAAGTAYVATSFETSDARGIEVGFLWDANRVDLLDAFQLTDAHVPGVSDAFGPSSASPGREPLVGVFEVEGVEITVIGNHFKSKSGDDPLFGVNDPPIRVTEVQRKAQARVVRDYVNLLLGADPEALVVVAGDLNDFPFGEPGEGLDHPSPSSKAVPAKWR